MTDLTREQKEALGRMMVEGCKKGDVEIISGCLKRGADPDVIVQDGDSGPKRPVLHWAAYHFNEKTMKALIDGGANLEARDAEGDTALFMAMKNQKPAAVECLMKNGADPLAMNNAKVVALDVARGMRTDFNEYAANRLRVIKALTGDYGPPRNTAKAAAAEPTKTEEDIQVLKPLELKPPKKGGGLSFNL